jgi:hypothetical protein
MPDEAEFTRVRYGKLMRLVTIEPSNAVLGADEITYRCAFCNHEEKRIRKPMKRDASPG